jgi:hypothetical protein
MNGMLEAAVQRPDGRMKSGQGCMVNWHQNDTVEVILWRSLFQQDFVEDLVSLFERRVDVMFGESRWALLSSRSRCRRKSDGRGREDEKRRLARMDGGGLGCLMVTTRFSVKLAAVTVDRALDFPRVWRCG